MSPEPRYGDDIPDEIVNTVQDVRLAQVKRHLDLDTNDLPKGHLSAGVENSKLQPLDEHRHENAYALAKALHNKGYTPYIVWGATPALRNKWLHELSVNKLDRMQNRTHLWVELNPEETEGPIIADIVARINGHHHTPYVSTDRPVRYQRMAKDPSYLKFDPAISADDLNTETGYEQLREAHPDLFAENPWREATTDFPDIPSTQIKPQHIKSFIKRLSGIQTKSDLQEAIWCGRRTVYEPLAGEQVTALAKALDWDGYEFPRKNGDSVRLHSTVLEEANNTELAILSPDGCVYQLGDVVRFETTRSRRGWGSSTSSETVTRENQIDYLSENHLSISRLPTYSNAPRDSPSATPGKTDIELVERSDLSKYRQRLTEGTDIDIPESVNGWELVNTEVRERDPEETLIPDGLVTEMKWSNGERTYITAKWRGAYECWRLSTPIEGQLCEENVDEYLYEIDVPQSVTTSKRIIELATEVMSQMPPSDFQAPYDLRDPETTDGPGDLRHGFAPITLPDRIGDWKLIEQCKYSLRWQNTNQQSAWHKFEVKIDSHGGVVVRNEPDEEVHDRRLIKKYTPSGRLRPGNIEDPGYAWRKREMFDENWYHGAGFLAQTSTQPLTDSVQEALNAQTPEGVDITTYDHELSTNAMESMDRENGTLLAY